MSDKKRVVLFVLPFRDFDLTEVSVPWKALQQNGNVECVFASPDGCTRAADALADLASAPACDDRLIGGVIFGQLGARPDAIRIYQDELVISDAFQRPRYSYRDLDERSRRDDGSLLLELDGLILPGGHKRDGMRRYLEDIHLQRFVGRFMASKKPVGAICHGTVVLSRSTVSGLGRGAGLAANERTSTSNTADAPPADEGAFQDPSCIAGRQVTGLTKPLEMAAWTLTAWLLGRYYRTYDVTVEDEVRAAAEEQLRRQEYLEDAEGLEQDKRVVGVPPSAPFFDRGPGGILASYDDPFTVVDGNLVTARWPGDATKFAKDFIEKLMT